MQWIRIPSNPRVIEHFHMSHWCNTIMNGPPWCAKSMNRRQLHYVILLYRLETVHFLHVSVQLSLIFFVRSKKVFDSNLRSVRNEAGQIRGRRKDIALSQTRR